MVRLGQGLFFYFFTLLDSHVIRATLLLRDHIYQAAAALDKVYEKECTDLMSIQAKGPLRQEFCNIHSGRRIRISFCELLERHTVEFGCVLPSRGIFQVGFLRKAIQQANEGVCGFVLCARTLLPLVSHDRPR